MVIGLVAHGDLLLSDLSPQLTVHKGDSAARRRGLLLEDAAHVVEEPGGAGEEGGRVIHVVKEKPGVLIALFRRQCEPADGGFPVLGNILAQQVQLSEGILGVLVSLLRRLRQPADSARCTCAGIPRGPRRQPSPSTDPTPWPAPPSPPPFGHGRRRSR